MLKLFRRILFILKMLKPFRKIQQHGRNGGGRGSGNNDFADRLEYFLCWIFCRFFFFGLLCHWFCLWKRPLLPSSTASCYNSCCCYATAYSNHFDSMFMAKTAIPVCLTPFATIFLSWNIILMHSPLSYARFFFPYTFIRVYTECTCIPKNSWAQLFSTMQCHYYSVV